MIPRHVVLLHGFTQGGAIWVPVMESITTRAAIEAPDLPGHGTAAEMRMRMPEIADLIADEFGPGAYVGYSMGGRVALHLALAHQHLVSHLVLCSTTAGIDDPDERAARRVSDRSLADHVRAVGLETFLMEWTSQPMFASLTRSRHDDEVRLANTADGLASSLEFAGTGEQDPLWDRLHELNMPVLVVTGANDAKFTVIGHRLVEAIGDNAQHVSFPDTGHAVPFERSADFAALITAFMR